MISTVQTIDYFNSIRPASETPIHYCYKLRKTIARNMARLGLLGRDGKPFSVGRISQITAELDHEYGLLWRRKQWEKDPITGEIRGQATRFGFYRKFGRPGLKYIRRLCEGWINQFKGLGQFFRRRAKQTATEESEGQPEPASAVKQLAADLFDGLPPLGGARDPAPG